MDTVAEAISDLDFAFMQLEKEIAKISESQAADLVIDQTHGYTGRDIVAHLTGWADYMLEVLPVMLSTIDNQLPPIDVAGRNRQALAAREGLPMPVIWEELKGKQQQIIDLLKSATPEALTMRRTRQSRIFTIKSYVVDVLRNHIMEYVDRLQEGRG